MTGRIDYGPESGGRVKGVCIVKPVVYGNIARYFGKKREEDGHTHQWTVYVKPYRNEDMSTYIKKVHFKLHDSYSDQNRVVVKPPYEVTETGWGEFEIAIKIFFHDSSERPSASPVYVKPYRNEDMSTYIKKVHFKLHDSYPDQNCVVVKPPYEVTETGWGEFEIAIRIFFHDSSERPSVTLYHILKLFQTGVDTMLGKKPLVTEYYEEIVFQDPTALMQNLLTTTRQLTIGPWKHETDFEEKKEKTLQNILNAKSKIHYEINDHKERLKLAKEAIAKFKAEIAKGQVDSPTNQRMV